MSRVKLADTARGLLWLALMGWLLVWAGDADAACGDAPAPGVDYSGCVLTEGLDGVADSTLTGLDLRDADLSGAQIYHRFDNMDFRGADFEGAAFRLSDGSLDNTGVSFENRDTRFYDTQFLLSVREEPPGSSEYRAGMFLKGVGLISPFDGNPYGMGGASGYVAVEQERDAGSGEPVPGDIAPIRYAVSIFDPWVSLGSNPNDSFGWQERLYSPAVTASSNGGLSGTAHYAVDGMAGDPGWISATEDSPWWEIDLGAHFRIEEVVLHARDAGGPDLDALRDAVVIVSDYPLPAEPLTLQNLDSISRYTVLGDPQAENPIPVNRTVRYLRIQKPPAAGQQLGFKTIELMGFLADAVGQPFTPDFPPPADTEIDPLANVPAECLGGNLFDPAEVRACEFPSPSQLLTGEILLSDPELDYSHCDLTGEILTNTSFNVTLQEGSLSGSFQLMGADFSGVDLRGADFSDIQLDGANFRGANLTDANFGDADITGADFRGAVLDGVDFGYVRANSCALFSNELPLTINPDINDEPGFPHPQAIVESTNVSYGYARQSSTDNDGVPTRAVDTDLASYSQTALEASPWWELDLGAVYNVEDVELLVDPAQESDLDDAVLLVSDWPLPGDAAAQVDGQVIAAYPLADVGGDSFFATLNRTARYLRIQKPDTGTPRRLSLSNVKVDASTFPTAPSSFVPLTGAQRDQLGDAAEFQDLLAEAQRQLEARGEDTLAGELAALSRDAIQLHDMLRRYKLRFDAAYTLRKSVSYAEKTVKALKLYRPLRRSPQIRKLEDSLARAKRAVNTVFLQYAAMEAAAEAGRRALREVALATAATNGQMNAALRYLEIGGNYLELNLRCALFDDAGASFIPGLNAKIADDIPLLQEYLVHFAADQDPRARMATHRAVIIATRLAIQPIDLEVAEIDQAVQALAAAFASVFEPIADIGEALSVEIDLGVYSLSAAEVIEAVEKALNAIPGLSEAEALVADLIDPLLAPLLDAVDVLPDVGLPDVPDIDRLAELVPQFDPIIHVPDPFVYDLPPFDPDFDDLADVACTGVTAPRLWPKDDEDLDGDGLPNGVELKRVSPDPYPGKLETLAGSADTDLDGLGDYFEVTLAQFVPTTTDFEGEVDADFDGDGLSNLDEFLNGTDPFLADSDGDGLSDAVEIAGGLDPNDPDTDGNGTDDAAEDSDADGLANAVEVALAMNLADGDDVNHDEDDDGVSNLVEFQRGTGLNNAPPTAVDDAVSLRPGQSAELDLLANDMATDGDPIELLEAQIEFPDRGQWSIDNGVVSFDAGSDFDGLVAGESETLKFIYRVQDPGGTASAVATVTVSVPGEDTGSGSGGGGSTGPWWLAGLALLALLRRKRAASAD